MINPEEGMTSRARVLKALNHEEPDRVPIDLGATTVSGIMAQAMAGLRRHLGIHDRPPRVIDVFQLLAEVEEDLVERLHVDVLPVMPMILAADLPRRDYQPWKLWDGTDTLVPGRFAVEPDGAGGLLLHDGGDLSRPVVGRMPARGFYFDVPAMYESHADYTPPPLAEIRKRSRITNEEVDFLATEAERLRPSGKALLLGGLDKIGLMRVGSIVDFLVLMADNPGYVKDLFALRVEQSLANLEILVPALGPQVDILAWGSFDYGSQRAELFSPDWFAEFFQPGWTILNRWVHEHTAWKTWQHSCGSIARFLPMLVDTGLDCINPVQCSAAGMAPEKLKTRYGHRLTFWGGGVDTQHTLCFGTPEQVRDEVRERLRVFAPGGGFVFNPVHNIQAGTPPENILAAFDTVLAGRPKTVLE